MIQENEQKLYPFDLQVNFQKEPLLNENEDIYFSWKLASQKYSLKQKAYQLLVFQGNGKGEAPCVWDSGLVLSDNTINIRYLGEPLQQESVYHWHLKVTANDDNLVEIAGGKFYTSCDWQQVDWITAKEEVPAVVFTAQHTLLAEKQIKSVLLYTSALGIYQIKINQHDIGNLSDGNQEVFYPGWTDYNELIHYQCYDLTEFIKEREIHLEALLGNGWFAGKISKNSFYEQLFADKIKKKCFIAKLVIVYRDGKKEIMQTNPCTWLSRIDTHIIENDFYDGEVVNYLTDMAFKQQEVVLPHFTNSLECMNRKLQPSKSSLVIKNYKEINVPVEGFLYNPKDIVNISEVLPYGELVKQPVAMVEPITLNVPYELILDFGQNAAAVFEVVLETLDDQVTTVIFETGEMLNDGKVNPKTPGGGSDGPKFSLYQKNLSPPAGGECLSCDKLLLRGPKTLTYSPVLTYHGFRFIKISTSGPIKITRMVQIPITSAIKKTGFIQTNNSAVNQLISNTFWSQRSNYLSIPTDCPQRSERVGWTGDAQIFLPTALYNFDVAAFLMNYADIINHSSTKAQYSSIIPQAFVPRFASIYASGWSDIGVILTWNLYKHTGNKDFVAKYFENMHRYMQEIGELDSIEVRYNPDMFGDWLSFQPTSTKFVNLMYRAYCATLMAEMASVLEKKVEASTYMALFQRIKTYVQEEYVQYKDNKFVLLTASRDQLDKSQHGYPFADNAQTGLVWFLKLKLYSSEKQREQALQKLIENIDNKEACCRSDFSEHSLSVGFLGIHVLLPTLAAYGKMNTAYDLLLNEELPSWLYSVKNGATTIWERWNSYSLEDSFADSRMNSFNHYSYGSVLEWLYEYAAGIDCSQLITDKRSIEIFPMIDRGKRYNSQERITELDCSYDSIVGKVNVSWHTKDNGDISYKITIPVNTQATLYLESNGENNSYMQSCAGVIYQGVTEKRGINALMFTLQSGTYRFIVGKTGIFIEETI